MKDQARIGRFVFLPEDKALNPTEAGSYTHIKDSWWIVHPELGLAFFQRAPGGNKWAQCNPNEGIMRATFESICVEWSYEIKFFESVWVPFVSILKEGVIKDV